MESTGPITGVEWLAAAAPDPEACRREWQRSAHGVALLPAGRRWDVLLVPGELGRRALRLLAQLPRRGPVLLDPDEDSIAFLVPVGTAEHWIGTGVRAVGEGGRLAVPHPARRGRGLHWLVPPDGSGTLTDPVELEFALHAAAAGLGGPDEELWGG